MGPRKLGNITQKSSRNKKHLLPIKVKRKPLIKPLQTQVSQIRLSNGALFILPQKEVRNVLSFFKGKTIQQLTTMSVEENRRVALALEKMPTPQFERLTKEIYKLTSISSKQAFKYFSGEIKGMNSTPMPFEDLMQNIALVRMLKKAKLKL